jgi:hypothetical protein
MNTENETNREVEYEQTGGTGTRDGGRCHGVLPPKARDTFPPCGAPPWVVEFTRKGAPVGSSPGISTPNATVRLVAGDKVVVDP